MIREEQYLGLRLMTAILEEMTDGKKPAVTEVIKMTNAFLATCEPREKTLRNLLEDQKSKK